MQNENWTRKNLTGAAVVAGVAALVLWAELALYDYKWGPGTLEIPALAAVLTITLLVGSKGAVKMTAAWIAVCVSIPVVASLIVMAVAG